MSNQFLRNCLWTISLVVGLMANICPNRACAAEPRSVLIELDGSGSNDPDGDQLQYKWKQIAGPKVTLSDANVAKPYFRTTKPGKYTFRLIVEDGKSVSDPALVEVMVERENLRPEAIVKDTINAEIGERVVIDGSASRDADGDELNFIWRQAGGYPLYISSEAARSQKLQLVPIKAGVYELELIVNDGKAYSHPKTVRLVVSPANKKPVARISATSRAVIRRPVEQVKLDFSKKRPTAYIDDPGLAQAGEKFRLDGRSSSSPEGKTLRYFWKQKSGPFIRVFDRDRDGVLGFTPKEEGEYVFELIVSDGENDSLPVIRKINVKTTNEAPIASIDAPEVAIVGHPVKLDGSGSFDREGENLSYKWRQIAGPRVISYSIDKALGNSVPAFIPQEKGRYTFELVVDDGQRKSVPARATIDVGRGDRAPSVEVAGNITVSPGETAVLQASGEDPEGKMISYEWKQVGGPKLLERPTTQRSLSLTPTTEGLYTFELVTCDGINRSLPARCTLTVKHSEGDEDFVPPLMAKADILETADPTSSSQPEMTVEESREAESKLAERRSQPTKPVAAPSRFFQRFTKPFKREKSNTDPEPQAEDFATSAAGPEL